MRASANHRYSLPLIGVLVALAWLALWAWGRSPYDRFLSHHHLDEVQNGSLLLVFISGWIVMIVAMMLPTSLPLVASFHTLTRWRADQGNLLTLLVVGYLCVWTLFGVMIYMGDWILHRSVEDNAWFHANARALGAATVALAGLYQFTPLKYYCLQRCRSPLSFIMEHWRGRHDKAQAFRLGAHHGLFCVGCCWSLMLLMFAIGSGNVGWMLALASVMAIEKNASWGQRLSTPLGVLLFGWSLVLFMDTPLWGAGY